MADTDFLLKIEGVDGESQDVKFKGAMEIDSWSWGETNTGTMHSGGGGGGGKVSMQDFHFVKKFDKASPVIMEACSTGKHIAKAELIGRKAGGEQHVYFHWTFTDILISSFQTGASGVNPTDSISFNFGKIEMEYKEQKKDGSLGGGIKKGYDVKTQQKT